MPRASPRGRPHASPRRRLQRTIARQIVAKWHAPPLRGRNAYQMVGWRLSRREPARRPVRRPGACTPPYHMVSVPVQMVAVRAHENDVRARHRGRGDAPVRGARLRGHRASGHRRRRGRHQARGPAPLPVERARPPGRPRRDPLPLERGAPPAPPRGHGAAATASTRCSASCTASSRADPDRARVVAREMLDRPAERAQDAARLRAPVARRGRGIHPRGQGARAALRGRRRRGVRRSTSCCSSSPPRRLPRRSIASALEDDARARYDRELARIARASLFPPASSPAPPREPTPRAQSRKRKAAR